MGLGRRERGQGIGRGVVGRREDMTPDLIQGFDNFLIHTPNESMANHISEEMVLQGFQVVAREALAQTCRIIVDGTTREAIDLFIQQYSYRHTMLERQRDQIFIVEIF